MRLIRTSLISLLAFLASTYIPVAAYALNVGGVWFSQDKKAELDLQDFLTNEPKLTLYRPKSCKDWQAMRLVDLDGESKFHNIEKGRLNRICWSLEHLASSASLPEDEDLTLPDGIAGFSPHLLMRLLDTKPDKIPEAVIQVNDTRVSAVFGRIELQMRLIASGFDLEQDNQPDWLFHVSRGDITGTYAHHYAVFLSRGENAVGGFYIQRISESFIW